MSIIAIIGGGPAGLMAGEVLASAGKSVHVYEQKQSLGRKFLMAGRGGLNLTHSEDIAAFLSKYGERQKNIAPHITAFTPNDLRTWCEGLGQETFIGSSGRVFPKAMKASPLLRAWISRLDSMGVQFHMRHTWQGWKNNSLNFLFDGQEKIVEADAALLALGGASWPSLGSDGAWAAFLGISLAPFRPANCGFICGWSDHMKKHAGQPLKSITLTHQDKTVPGEIMITENGIEGGAVYALSSSIRNSILHHGDAKILIDLRPFLSRGDIFAKLKPRGRMSMSTYLQKTLGFNSTIATLLRETAPDLQTFTNDKLADLIKSLPLRLSAPFPIDRAISTAGGIPFDELDENFMLRNHPGVFAAGEMLDWEAPTGGYLLQATFSTARAAAEGVLKWLETRKNSP